MSQPNNSRYQGRFLSDKARSPKALGGGLLLLVVLVLGACRLGAEYLRLRAYADLYTSGGRLLIYQEVEKVDLGPSIGGQDHVIPVYTDTPATEPEGDYIINNGNVIVYQGHTYELNENLTTILVMGIDRDIEEQERMGNGGQSDVMLVVALDTVTGDATLLNLSRDTYGQVDVYSAANNFIETRFEQITLAYAYGNGKETSAENAVRTVSRLLYGLPISSYLAVDLDGILAANEFIGGVTLKSLIDVNMPDGTKVKAGDIIELHGKNLERYIRSREKDLEGNTRRMEQQKQYMTAFASEVIARSQVDATFPVQLFATLAPYIVTDLDVSDITFLSSAFLSHGASFTFRSLEGTYDWLDHHSAFYPDEVDLFEAVLQLFYKRVD